MQRATLKILEIMAPKGVSAGQSTAERRNVEKCINQRLRNKKPLANQNHSS